ncbi:MAG: RNA polymerase sigma-70 factor [Bacteroidales bacterium]
MDVEKDLLLKIKQGDKDAFAIVFKKYYTDLVLFCGTIIQDRDVCEDIVQNLFLSLWENRKEITIQKAVKSYLIAGVKNKAFDNIRHEKVKCAFNEYWFAIGDLEQSVYDTENYVLYSELSARLNHAILNLPEKQKQVFLLSNQDNLKQKEIAAKLGVSLRTVELRMHEALKILKVELQEFLFFLLFVDLF